MLGNSILCEDSPHDDSAVGDVDAGRMRGLNSVAYTRLGHLMCGLLKKFESVNGIVVAVLEALKPVVVALGASSRAAGVLSLVRSDVVGGCTAMLMRHSDPTAQAPNVFAAVIETIQVISSTERGALVVTSGGAGRQL